MNKNLNDIQLREYLAAANQYAKIHTAQISVLQKAIQILEKNNNDLEKILEISYVHPQIIEYLKQHIPLNYPDFTTEDYDLLRDIYSKNYHTESELVAFANLVDTKIVNPELRYHLAIVFGLDGFYGKEFARYIKNLQYGIREDQNTRFETKNADNETVARIVHLRAVRYLYEQFGVTPVEKINEVIQKAFNKEEEQEQDKMTQSYVSDIGSLFDDIRKLYHVENASVDMTE